MAYRPSGAGFLPAVLATDGPLALYVGGAKALDLTAAVASFPAQVYANYGGSAFVAPGGGMLLGGDINAAGGYRHNVGPWQKPSVAAGVTNQQIPLCTAANNSIQWTAPRAGSITGLTLKSTINAAGATLTATVYKNGVATAMVATIVAGAAQGFATAAKDTITFAAGDVLDIRITTPGGWTSTTLELAGWIELEN